jgi:Flp pilus assembly protein TadG
MMRQRLGSLMRRLGCDERGAILPIVAVSLPVLFGATALAIDFGRYLQVQQKLQAATDAAALAGAQGLSNGTSYTGLAQTYSSSAAVSGINTIPGVTVAAPTITARCSTTLQSAAIPCTGSISAGQPVYNVISVTQTAQVPLIFGSAIGVKPLTTTATAYASAAGGNPPSLNVMVIVDTTGSMSDNDPNCTIGPHGASVTRLACAENGLQSILNTLYPSIDYIGLEVFPGVTSASAVDDTNCKGTPTTVEYGISGFSGSSPTDTYTIVGLSSNCSSSGTCYRTSNSSKTLNSNSPLVGAAGTGSTSACLQNPAGDGTYYADAINQAQSNLAAFKTSLGSAGDNSQNVIIVLSDGEANATYSKTGHSDIVQAESTDECQRGIVAANAAKSAGTWVYTVAYGSSTTTGSSSDCTTDTSNLSPVNQSGISAYCTMAEMASSPTSNQIFFYSDVSPPSSCPGISWTLPAKSANIAAAFQDIAQGLASTRLIPAYAYNN